MIRKLPGISLLAPLPFLLAGGVRASHDPLAETTAPPCASETDAAEPAVRVLRGPSGPALGAGECSSDVVLELWPPNHKYVDIDLAEVLPPGTVGIQILGISQDEPVEDLGDGHTVCDGDGVGTSFAHIRSERSGLSDGRVYVIEYSAFGGGCTGIVTVTVPHDRRGTEAEDSGQDFDSTEDCP